MAVARAVAQRSLCSRDRVGAVIVSKTNRIIDTGYNGPPSGWQTPGDNPSCSWWCTRAIKGTMRGHKHKPDCSIVTTHHLTCTCGAYREPQEALESDYSDCPSLHAEANALMFSDRRLREGGTIYVTSGTCSGCAKLVANSGLDRAVYATTDREISHRDSGRWYDFMQDCGLEIIHYEPAER